MDQEFKNTMAIFHDLMKNGKNVKEASLYEVSGDLKGHKISFKINLSAYFWQSELRAKAEVTLFIDNKRINMFEYYQEDKHYIQSIQRAQSMIEKLAFTAEDKSRELKFMKERISFLRKENIAQFA